MDTRPIGVFDSGLGGLTAVKELERLLPDEKIVYFGDTGRVPYGTKGSDTIIKYALQDIRFLRTFDVKAIVIACGTVSSVAFNTVSREFSLPIIGVVEPTAAAAAAKTKSGNIGVIATAATISTGCYEREILKLMPKAKIMSRACPMFVPLVENGYFTDNSEVATIIAHEYLDDFKGKVDTLILGCTHYPLLSGIIKKILPDVTLINSGYETALKAADIMKENILLSEKANNEPTRFFVSDRASDFTKLSAIFLEHEVTGSVEKIDIEKF